MANIMSQKAKMHVVYGMPLAPASADAVTHQIEKDLDDTDTDFLDGCFQRGLGKPGLLSIGDPNDASNVFGFVVLTKDLHKQSHHMVLPEFSDKEKAAMARKFNALWEKQPARLRAIIRRLYRTRPSLMLVMDIE